MRTTIIGIGALALILLLALLLNRSSAQERGRDWDTEVIPHYFLEVSFRITFYSSSDHGKSRSLLPSS